MSFLCLLLATSLLHAQTRQLRFEQIALAGNLTDYRALDVAQDSIGFLWFATEAGLYRYDGLTTTPFKPRLNDTAGISSMTIWSLLTDRGGRLWIGTFDAGLDCFDPRAGTFRHFRHDPSDTASISSGPITALLEDHAGSLWIGTENSGLVRFDSARQRFVRFCHDPKDRTSLSNNSVNAICEDARGTLWVGTDDGLNALEPGSMTFRIFRHDPQRPSTLTENFITSLWCDRSGALWAGTKSRGLNRLDELSRNVIRYCRSSMAPGTVFCDSITAMFQGQGHWLWVGTVAGLYRFDPVSGSTQRFTHDPFNSTSISSDRVRALRGDRTGTLWIATDYFGTDPQLSAVNKLVQKSDQFAYFRVERHGGGALPVTAILNDPRTGTTWIGTEGLRAFHRASGRIVEYVHNPADPSSLSDDLVSSLCLDRSGTLWVGTFTGGVNRFLPSTSSFARYRRTNEDSTIGGNALCICEDQPAGGSTPGDAANLWIGTFDEGLLYFLRSRGVVRRYLHSPSDARTLGNNRVLAVLVDRKGVLWVGTDGGGLNRFDRSTERFTRYGHNDKDPSSLRSSRVCSLLEDPASYSEGGPLLWVGTATGLDRFDALQARATHIMLNDSAEAIGVLGMALHDEDLWVSTAEDGLFKHSLRTGKTRVYREQNGLPTNFFSRAHFSSTGSEILLGQYEGFIAFHPDDIRDNLFAPPVVLTAFNVFDAPYQTPQPLWTVPLIRLNHDQDFFSFRFAALDYTDPEKNAFAYKLEGFDNDWNQPGTRSFAGYTKVDPGDYTFRVRGANSDGKWNESGVSIGLRIEPPYWRTWWFQGLIGAVVLAMIIGAYQYRVARLLEMERMRLRIASDLHDDIGSSLSGIALVTESLKSRAGLEDKDRQHLTDVTRTARRTADALRDIVWIVNPDHDTLEDLLLRLKDATVMILTGIEHTTTITGTSLSHKMSIEFRHNLILIYKEILNNIARHARAHTVNISIHQEDDLFSLRVVDDGVGFDTKAASRGNGLNNLHNRARQIGGVLTLESTPRRGTFVTFSARVT